MAVDVDRELSNHKKMSALELREKYAQLHGEPSRSGNRDYLVKRIIWRLQAIDEGGFAERVNRIRTQAAELARDADLRLQSPSGEVQFSVPHRRSPRKIPNSSGMQSDRRLPMPGTILSREYRGQTIQVRVLDKGFEHGGRTFRSLSAIAHAITGSHWNGWLFFGLTQQTRKGDAR